jgi:DNA-binding MarR family transcriptional regulator
LVSNYIASMKTDHVVQLISGIRGKAYKFIAEELRANQIHGIVPSHGGILDALFKEEKLPMKSLAEKIDRDKSTVTSLVQKLIKMGYVKKIKEGSDMRVNYIVLTRKGRDLEPVFEDISKKLIERFYKGLNREEKNSVVSVLERIDKNW